MICYLGKLHRRDGQAGRLPPYPESGLFSDTYPGFLLFDHTNDLGFRETALSHSFAPSKG